MVTTPRPKETRSYQKKSKSKWRPKCQHDECTTRPSYNIRGERKGLYCKTHKLAGMIDVHSKTCQQDGCNVQPVFNHKGETKGLYCTEHKLDGMVNVQDKTCQHDGCDVLPTYNHPGQTKALYCKHHKLTGMIDIKHKPCQYDGCGVRPNFNHKGQAKAIYCKDHKLAGMVNVTSKMCQQDGCEIQPSYNHPGQTKGLYCKEHKLAGMVNVVSKTCQEDECEVQPSYNHPGQTKGLYCNEHKLSNMVDVRSKTCQQEGCEIQPIYNHKGQTKALYCKEHKLVDMVDVRSKMCQDDECGTRAWIGVPGKPASHCAEHRQEGMISYPKQLCMEPKCRGVATYGISRAIHCENHAMMTEEKCFIGARCSSCNLVGVLNDGLCEYCDPDILKKVRLAKQRETKLWLDATSDLNDYTIYDKVIDSGACGKERPDFMWEDETHCTILEVDEDQHQGRDPQCEHSRMVNISQSNGMATVFIRYNPDQYKPATGSKQVTIFKRREILLDWIRHLRKTPPNEFLKSVYLFFDGYKCGNERINSLIPFQD
jgi:hypothetical protein